MTGGTVHVWTVVLDVQESSFAGAVAGDGLTISGSGVAVIDVDLDGVRFADNHNRGLAVAASSGSPTVDVTVHGGSAVDDSTGPKPITDGSSADHSLSTMRAIGSSPCVSTASSMVPTM